MKTIDAPGTAAGDASPSMAAQAAMREKAISKAVAPNPGKLSDHNLRQEVFLLTEKLLRRLPASGAVILVGSLGGVSSKTASPSTDSNPEGGSALFRSACARLGFQFGQGAVLPASERSNLPGQLALGLQIVSSKPVLLVDFSRTADCCAQNPAMADKPGLTDVLRGSATMQEALRSTSRPALKILGYGSGGGIAGELVISNSFREFLQNARGEFPWIILHCPSLLEREESASLISRADALLASAKRGQSRARDVQFIRELCSQLKTDFLGMVLV